MIIIYTYYKKRGSMIRIIFDNGELMECEHINKIYIDEADIDKVTTVFSIKILDAIKDEIRNMEKEESNE